MVDFSFSQQFWQQWSDPEQTFLPHLNSSRIWMKGPLSPFTILMNMEEAGLAFFFEMTTQEKFVGIKVKIANETSQLQRQEA